MLMYNVHAENQVYRGGRTEGVCAAAVGLLIIVSMQPVYLLSKFALAAAYAILAVIIIGSAFLSNGLRRYWGVRYLAFYISVVLFFLCMYFPFRKLDTFNFYSVVVALALFCMALKASYIKASCLYVEKYFFVITLLGLFSYILFVFKIPFPEVFKVHGESNNLTYTSYFFSFKVSGQQLDLLGVGLYRNSSIFPEPGHYGLYLALFLLLFWAELGVYKRIIYLLALVTTFSAASYMAFPFILILAFFKVRTLRARDCLKGAAVFAVAVIAIYLLRDVISARVISKFGGGSISNVLSERAVTDLSLGYILSNSPVLGLGRDALEVLGITSSDYKVYILRFGFIGVVSFVFMLCMFQMLLVKDKIAAAVISLFVVAIFLHRSWMIDKVYIYYLMACFFVWRSEA